MLQAREARKPREIGDVKVTGGPAIHFCLAAPVVHQVDSPPLGKARVVEDACIVIGRQMVECEWGEGRGDVGSPGRPLLLFTHQSSTLTAAHKTHPFSLPPPPTAVSCLFGRNPLSPTEASIRRGPQQGVVGWSAMAAFEAPPPAVLPPNLTPGDVP